MGKRLLTILMTAISLMACSQNQILLTSGGKVMTATLADNSATRELLSQLSAAPISIQMDDYGGFEKVGVLPHSLPVSDSRIAASAGDIMLYQGNNLVIFYGQNSWSYTPIGKIEGVSANELREFLGSGEISLTISLPPSSSLEGISADSRKRGVIYDLNGNRMPDGQLPDGIYIINGKKTNIK